MYRHHLKRLLQKLVMSGIFVLVDVYYIFLCHCPHYGVELLIVVIVLRIPTNPYCLGSATNGVRRGISYVITNNTFTINHS